VLRRLLPGDFLGDPFEVARNVVLGAVLETNIGGVRTAGLITEAEVYIGGSDKASHTYGYRRTERVMSQYEMGGHAYVFLVYGIHAQFCVVLGEKDVPNVVLVRSVMPLWGADEMLRRRGKIEMDEGISSLGEKANPDGEISLLSEKTNPDRGISSLDGKTNPDGEVSSLGEKMKADGEVSSRGEKAKADREMSSLCGKTKPGDGMFSRRIKAKLDATLCAGPGNATKALGITTRLNGVDLCTSDEIGLYVPVESGTGANGAGLRQVAEFRTNASGKAGLHRFAKPEIDGNEVGLHSFAEPETEVERDTSSRAVMPCSEEMLRAIMSARADEIVEAPRVGIDYAEEYAAMKWRYYYRNNRFVSKKLKGV